MEVTTKELRIQPGKILEQVTICKEITITYRGKPLARIVPFQASRDDTEDATIFGMWKDQSNETSVEEQVRNIRKGRTFDN